MANQGGLGRERKGARTTDFCGAVEHGGVAHHAAAGLDVGARMARVGAPRGAAQSEGHAVPDVEPDGAVAQVGDGPLHRIADRGDLHGGGAGQDGAAERAPDDVVAESHGGVDEGRGIGSGQGRLGHLPEERLDVEADVVGVPGRDVADEGPGQCVGRAAAELLGLGVRGDERVAAWPARRGSRRGGW